MNTVSIVLLTSLVVCSASQTITLPENELLTDQLILEREYQNYQLLVTNSYAKAGDYLSISAFATSYGSDPDIYVSKVSLSV